jgi:alanine racemase
VSEASRWAWAEVDLDAVSANVRALRDTVAPVGVWAVVKANAYGHGTVPVAHAALAAGAGALCVALVEEGVALRGAGIDAPILVLSEQPPEQVPAAAAAGLHLTVSSLTGVEAARGIPMHLKVDTGMHRAGCPPGEAATLARAIGPDLAGVSTHLACADDPCSPVTAQQLTCFAGVLRELREAGLDPGMVHAANSAAALGNPAARFDAVRTGIAVYGLCPGPGVAHLCGDLRPALRLVSRVSAVRRLGAGEGISYGHRYTTAAPTTTATVPIGYADGVPRQFARRGEALLRGRRRRVAGVVTMDQLVLDCGDDPVAVGDEVVLLGRQGDEEITADEWAERLETITYEVTCGISGRVPRRWSQRPMS